MELKIKRIAFKDTYTIGKLSINEKYFCDTLEDCVRQGRKVMHETAIPVGRYKILWTFSTRFKKYMIQIADVPNFEGVRIHAGNSSEDTSGCPLVGKNTEIGKVTNSRFYANSLNVLVSSAIKAKQDVWITIE